MLFDIAVIGAGLFGSASAKYLQKTGLKTILIGPNEPDIKNFNTSRVYGSHYDQGRITRRIGKTIEWTELNILSQNAFEKIEEESGISFFDSTGCLYISDIHPDPHLILLSQKKIISPDQTVHQLMSTDQVKSLIPYFHIEKPIEGYLEAGKSGYLNPRKLIEAQKKIFKHEGGFIQSDVVEKVVPKNGYFQIKTEHNIFESRKVVYTTGAFHNFFEFGTKDMPLKIKTETIVLGEVDRSTYESMQKMPSVLYNCKELDYDEVYFIKPLIYPDGKYYIKLGANLLNDRLLHSLKEVQEWFRGPTDDDQKRILKKILYFLFPKISFLSFQFKHCIIEYTDSGHPMIQSIEKNQSIAIGGNGYGAMCSDGVGQKICELIMKQ